MMKSCSTTNAVFFAWRMYLHAHTHTRDTVRQADDGGRKDSEGNKGCGGKGNEELEEGVKYEGKMSKVGREI